MCRIDSRHSDNIYGILSLKTKVKTLNIEHFVSGCDGKLKLLLPDYEIELSAGYTAGNKQISDVLPVDEIREVFLHVRFATLNKAKTEEKKIVNRNDCLSYDIKGIYEGTTTISGEDYHRIDSVMPLLVDEEFTTEIPYERGDYIVVKGEFFVDMFD